MRTKLCLTVMAFSMFVVGSAFGQESPAAPTGTANGPDASSPQNTTPPEEKPMRIRIGGNVMAAKITHMIQPAYPQAAKAAHISGTVVLHCIIAKDGSMRQVEYVSGPPVLMKAAMDAVRQWTYQPTKLNGKAVEVDTAVSVVFNLSMKSSSNAEQHGAVAGTNQDSTPVPVDQAPDDVPVSASIDPGFKADILRLMDVSHLKTRQTDAMRVFLVSMRPGLLSTIPATPNREKIVDAYIDKFVELVGADDFTNAVIPLYAKYLTDDDVKAAISFYETPAGQHYLESAQKLTPEAVQIGQRIALEHLPDIIKNLCKEYPELQGEAKFCGSADPTKKSLLFDRNPVRGN
jgi:TonB family protein